MKDNLPPNFTTWNQFYNSFKDKTDPSINEVNYELWIPDDSPTGRYQQIYRYTIDEVKAHCFDEFLEWYEKNISYDQWDPYPDRYIVDKIDDLIGIKRKA